MAILNPDIYKKLAKSNPEKLKAKQDQKCETEIHKVLSEMVGDTKLRAAVKEYGHPLAFADGHNPVYAFQGYHHLEIDPEIGPVIVIEELDFMADKGNETHGSRYPLYIRDKKVFFKGEDNKEIDAAKAVRHEGVFGCNVDYSKAQTARGILKSLEKAVNEALGSKSHYK